jgi:hypothetical protein
MAYETLAGYDNWKLQNSDDAIEIALDDECDLPCSVFEPNERVRIVSGPLAGKVGQVIGFNKRGEAEYEVCFGWNDDETADSDLFDASELESA